MDFLDQEVVNYGPWAKSWPPPIFTQVQAKNGFYVFLMVEKKSFGDTQILYEVWISGP